jgi:hypothetical protein
MRKLIVVLFLACSASLFAQQQTFTIGTLPQTGTTQQPFSPGTFVDLTHPATAAAVINTVQLRWLSSGGTTCVNAFKVKFVTPATGNTSFTVNSERGPFTATQGDVTVQISPPVSVSPGDLLAVTTLQATDTCGSVAFSPADPSQRLWRTARDIATSGTDNFNNGTFVTGLILNALGKSGTDVLAGVITAAGATQGIGAFFRTAIQMTNPDSSSNAIGRLVYHPQGRSAQATDATLAYNLAPGATTAYADVVTTMGQSGLGSMDVIAQSGPLPVITTRVFSDNGAAGTLGFTEDTVTPEQVLKKGEIVLLSLPADPANFRMNIGVRTLFDGASMFVVYNDNQGHQLATFSKTYSTSYFEQVSLSQFVGISTVAASGSLLIAITDGSAIVYGSTTDNRTTDSAIKFAGR